MDGRGIQYFAPAPLSVIVCEAEMAEIAVISDLFVRLLGQSSPRPLRGTELSVLAKTAYPDFRPLAFGCRTLRDFIRKNVPDVVEFGRAGMDVSYRLRSEQEHAVKTEEESPALHQLTTDSRLWKTFATPDSYFQIYLVPETGMAVVKHPNSKPLPGWRELPKISGPALLQIGRDSAAGQDESGRTILDPILQEERWWIPYYERLQSLGLKSKWIEFRRRRIRAEFHRLLGETAKAETPVAVAASAPVLDSRTPIDPIRKIAAEVILRMTESELRALNLPLGYVMDALTVR